MSTPKIDLELVSRAAVGDQAAFRELVEQSDRMVTALLIDRIGRKDDVQDLRQEVFFRVYKGLESLREREAYSAWLRGICRNVVREYFAARSRAPSALEESMEPVIDASRSDDVRSIEYAMNKALEVLPARYREVLRLRYFAKMNYEEIANTLSLSGMAVDALVRRAKARLRDAVIPLLEREHLR